MNKVKPDFVPGKFSFYKFLDLEECLICISKLILRLEQPQKLFKIESMEYKLTFVVSKDRNNYFFFLGRHVSVCKEVYESSVDSVQVINLQIATKRFP